MTAGKFAKVIFTTKLVFEVRIIIIIIGLKNMIYIQYFLQAIL